MKLKNFIFSIFCVCAFLLTGRDAYAQRDTTFNETGAVSPWVVPCSVTSITVDMAGAQGGSGGGTGGRVQCTYSTTPGTTLYIYVGGAGASAGSAAAGGFNGGGNAGAANSGSVGSGGGGASDIRVGGMALANRVIIAGGGGGINTVNNTPGAGGDTIGGNSSSTGNGCIATYATGGTQSAGGLDATSSGVCCTFIATPDGSLGLGANGAGPSSPCNGGDGGGGGGGGYFGGGGGGGYASGAGGSSFTDANSTNVIHTQGYQSGNGYVTISWNGPAELTGIVSVSNVTCNNATNGSAAIAVSGGITPYTYSWTGGNTTNSVTGLSAGTYVITVTDSCGITLSASAIITQPNTISITAADSMSVSCNGGNNGIAKSTLSGGTSPFTYLWSDANSQATATATGLVAGTYTVTVTDSCGGSSSASVIIGQPNALSIIAADSMNVSCNGGNNGIAKSTLSGGTSPYIYVWSDANSQATATATGLVAGTYTVTVTDSCGASSSASVIIGQPNALSASATVNTNVSCNGGNDGSATASNSGGTSPFTYLWSDANSQATANATGLIAGTYTVTVSDSCGATASASVTITAPTGLTIVTNVTANVSCNGGNNAIATVTASNGGVPYTYLWSDNSSQTTATATGLSAGTYTITVNDMCSSTATASVTITQPLTALGVTASTVSNVTCNGGINGETTSTATGGTTPYTYLWSGGGGSSATATDLSAGTYTVNVTDNNGCTASASTTVTQPTALIVTAYVSSNITCHGDNNGIASSFVNGGVSPYTYLWSDASSQATPSATGLSAGTYTLTVTDSNGCFTTATTILTQPVTLRVTASVTANVNCNGEDNGSASSVVTGGTSPYNYSWSDPNLQVTQSATGLSAGSYTVNIIDNNGCTASAAITITQPLAALNVTVSITSNVNCNGGNNGIASSVVTGGTNPYTYTWSVGGTSATVSNLSAGTYTLNVLDFHGCSNSASVTITEPAAALSLSAIVTANVTCNAGDNGSAVSIVNGGTGPYTYAWAPAGGNNATASDLSAGTYTLTTTDNHGCTASASIAITQPLTALNVSAVPTASVTCNGGSNGSATSSVNGGVSPYTYSWSVGGTTASINNLSAGTYVLTVEDFNGCTNSVNVTIMQPSILSVAAAITNNVACNGGSDGLATSNVSGGVSPYTYAWAPAGGNASVASDLSAGTYTVTITDNHGCTNTAAVNVTQPAAISIVTNSRPDGGSNDGSAWVHVSGGYGPYHYSWSPGGGATDSIYGKTHGTYCCTITDANGCTSSACVDIKYNLGVDNIASNSAQINVYPNPNNGQFTIQSSVVNGTASVEIYNILGKEIYTSSLNAGKNRNTTINIGNQPNGIYLYRVISNEDGSQLGDGKIILQK